MLRAVSDLSESNKLFYIFLGTPALLFSSTMASADKYLHT